jgi:hypothetical protein
MLPFSPLEAQKRIFHEQDNIFSWYNFHTSYVTGRESETAVKSISINFYFPALFLFHSLSLNRIFFFTSIQNHCCFLEYFFRFHFVQYGTWKNGFYMKMYVVWYSIVNVHALLCLPVFEVTEDRMG